MPLQFGSAKNCALLQLSNLALTPNFLLLDYNGCFEPSWVVGCKETSSQPCLDFPFLPVASLGKENIQCFGASLNLCVLFLSRTKFCDSTASWNHDVIPAPGRNDWLAPIRVVLITLASVLHSIVRTGQLAPCKDEQLADWSAHSCDASISSQIIPRLHCL